MVVSVSRMNTVSTLAVRDTHRRAYLLRNNRRITGSRPQSVLGCTQNLVPYFSLLSLAVLDLLVFLFQYGLAPICCRFKPESSALHAFTLCVRIFSGFFPRVRPRTR